MLNLKIKSKKIILKHKLPSIKRVAAGLNSRNRFKNWQWTPVITINIGSKNLTALLDSGASHSLITTKELKNNLTKINSKPVKSIWKTCGSSTCPQEKKIQK